MNCHRIIKFFLLGALCLPGCIEKEPEPKADPRKPTFPLAIQTGRFFEKNGVRYLWGGKNADQHFVVDNLVLKPEQFHFGVGREYFAALIKPEFIPAYEANAWLPDSARVLGLLTGETAKAYPLFLLEQHEVVNDVSADEPIVVVYCNLANLAAIYERTIKGRVHTFGQSGYTYFDPKVWEGKDGFVLWDRETESLWWPLIGKAVSGPMLNTPMRFFDPNKWRVMAWAEWRAQHPATLVLDKGQDFDRPNIWPLPDQH
jgi:hypothetical protein